MSGPSDSIGLIDSHCHLQYFLPDERQAAIDRARSVGVTGFLIPAVKLADAEDILRFAEESEDVWCAIGVHPHEAGSWQSGDQERLASWLDHPKVVAVGECGLDFYYDHAPRDQQILAMREQWEVALDHGLPVVVHNRDSDEAMLSQLESDAFSRLSGVLHSFAAGNEVAEIAAGHGFYFGLSGMVTFPKADNVREILGHVPNERLLLETDTPYLAPVPHRGKKNEPAFMVETTKRVADELSLPIENLAPLTTGNFFRLFERA